MVGPGVNQVTFSGYNVSVNTAPDPANRIVQIVEPIVFGYASLASQQVTISVENPSQNIVVAVGSVTATIPSGSGRQSATLTIDAADTGNLTVSMYRPGGGLVTFSRAQMVLGSTAATWAARTQPQELLLCQRYYYIRRWVSGVYNVLFMVSFFNTTQAWGGAIYFPTTMRTTPVIQFSAPADFRIWVTSALTVTGITSFLGDVNACWIAGNITVSGSATAGQAGIFYFHNVSTAFVAANAEFA
jgi:hypothetical protein